MNCPKIIPLKLIDLSVDNCKKNLEFWKKELAIDTINESDIEEVYKLSNSILPCHTTSYESIEKIFFSSDNPTYLPDATGLLSLDIRKKRIGIDIEKLPSPIDSPHMKDSIKLGHQIFLFAYHNVHNPYHRQQDEIPIKPIGFFLKTEVELLTCVHASPCDVAEKNNLVDKYRANDLDKFYLCPKDLRYIKPFEIYNDPYLKNDFWYYFGNSESWVQQKGYGLKLFERAGELRYLNCISPEQIEAVLWPTWKDDEETMERNWNLYVKFRESYPKIKRIQYNRDKYNNNWALSFVEASYYSQRHYTMFGYFEDHADDAKLKIDNI